MIGYVLQLGRGFGFVWKDYRAERMAIQVMTSDIGLINSHLK